MMKNILLSLGAALVLQVSSSAQISHGGQPESIANQPEMWVRTPAVDLETLKTEDTERDQYKEFGYRFGYEFNVNINPENSGQWNSVNDKQVWTVTIFCEGAQTINILFDQFNLPEGASVFITNEEGSEFVGALTHENNKKWGSLATQVIHSEKVQIQLWIPNEVSNDNFVLNIGQITHGYRAFAQRWEDEQVNFNRGPFGNSGPCNVNINCPDGDLWQNEKKSVALIASGGFAVCSGAMVNNTSQDGTPYFLTANHCTDGANVGNWVFYFNHESDTCEGNSGPTTDSVSGASLVANNPDSDFGLLELSSIPPAGYGVVYAGWDNSDSAPTAVTGIHHPSGDVKKICHDIDGPNQANQGGAEVWYINQWEVGVTEGGSSGSPLFDQNHHIVGQLFGGFAACAGDVNNGEADWFGRFGVSWDGPSPETRLKDWLDPMNQGISVLEPFPNAAANIDFDVAAQSIMDLPETLCQTGMVSPAFNLVNFGNIPLESTTITIHINGGDPIVINWTGLLNQWESETIPLPEFYVALGENTVEVNVSMPNGQADENVLNNSTSATSQLIIGQTQINLSLLTDDFGYETYWEIRDPGGSILAYGGNESTGANGGDTQSATVDDPGAYANNFLVEQTLDFAIDGCFEFYIIDDYGDGICCGFGDGNFEITDANGTVMAAGGNFGAFSSKEFGMEGGLSLNEKDVTSFSIFPNPTHGLVQVRTRGSFDQKMNIIVSDLSGRVVMRERGSNSTEMIVLDLKNLAKGTYFITLSDIDTSVTKKVIVK